MNVSTQLTSFYLFFLFGLTLIIIFELFLRKKQYFCYLYFPILTLAFTLILFHFNNGKIHPYFFILFLLGLLVGKIIILILKQKIKLFIKKHKK